MNPETAFQVDENVERIRNAMHELLIRDQDLLLVDVHERTIMHKIAEYLRSLFHEWDVDCEYNRDGHEPKRIMLPFHPRFNPNDKPTREVSPDIIIHKRRSDNNLIAIEIKKSSNKDSEEFWFDKVKLQKYLQNLHYRMSVFIVVNTDSTLGQPYTLERITLEHRLLPE